MDRCPLLQLGRRGWATLDASGIKGAVAHRVGLLTRGYF